MYVYILVLDGLSEHVCESFLRVKPQGMSMFSLQLGAALDVSTVSRFCGEMSLISMVWGEDL
jgi:hypothetical protein